MSRTSRRFTSPDAIVAFHKDGKPPGRVKGDQVWSLPFTLTYSAPHPKTTRYRVTTYRVYHALAEPDAPFIVVRGERLYLTPSYTRKALEL